MTRWLLLTAALSLASCAPAQSTRKRDWLFLLPVKIQAELNEEDTKLMSLLARGLVIKGFDDKDLPTVSSTQMVITERELSVDLAADGGWTSELFTKLHDRWKMRYLATLTVVQLDTKEGAVDVPPGSPPPPGGTLITTAKVVGSLFDYKTGKFIFENKESVVTHKVGRPGPWEQQIKDERSRALMESVQGLFKKFLSKLPAKKPRVGVNAGGG